MQNVCLSMRKRAFEHGQHFDKHLDVPADVDDQIPVVLMRVILPIGHAFGQEVDGVEENDDPGSDFLAETLLNIRTREEGAARIHDVGTQRSEEVPDESQVDDEGEDVRTDDETDETNHEESDEQNDREGQDFAEAFVSQHELH